jgi:hypothetical protein
MPDAIMEFFECLVGINREKSRDDRKLRAFLDVGFQEFRDITAGMVISDARHR